MGGWISVIVSIIPVYLFWKNGLIILSVIAVVNLLINFWSFGIMHNFYYRARQNRLNKAIELVPNWVTMINIATAIIGLVLLIISIVQS